MQQRGEHGFVSFYEVRGLVVNVHGIVARGLDAVVGVKEEFGIARLHKVPQTFGGVHDITAQVNQFCGDVCHGGDYVSEEAAQPGAMPPLTLTARTAAPAAGCSHVRTMLLPVRRAMPRAGERL